MFNLMGKTCFVENFVAPALGIKGVLCNYRLWGVAVG